jgi:hypothetical protein
MAKRTTPKKSASAKKTAKKATPANRSAKKSVTKKTPARKSVASTSQRKKVSAKKPAAKAPASESFPRAAAHAASPDKIPGTIAKIVTETDGSKTVYVWDQHGQPIRQDLFHG